MQLTSTNARSCTSTDELGLTINGRQLSPTRTSNLALQSHVGPLGDADFENPLLNNVRWLNLCGCPAGVDEEDCNDNFEFVLIFELLGLGQIKHPGFTLSYKQHGKAELLRLSNFPDFHVVGHSTHGLQPHGSAPLIELASLERGAMPTSTLFASFSSFQSLATPVASFETRVSGHVISSTEPASPTTTSMELLPLSRAQSTEPPTPSLPLVPLLTTQGHGTWSESLHRSSEAFEVFEQSLFTIGDKAKQAAQSLVESLHSLHHCSLADAPRYIVQTLPSASAVVSSTPSNTARALPSATEGSAATLQKAWGNPIFHISGQRNHVIN